MEKLRVKIKPIKYSRFDYQIVVRSLKTGKVKISLASKGIDTIDVVDKLMEEIGE